MQEENKPELSRRRLLRRASTVAAGVGAAGVASAAIGAPAQATDGQPLIQGQVNTGGSASTTIENASSTNPTVVLRNSGGAGLAVSPDSAPVFEAPVGSIFTDREGGLYTVGDEWYDFGEPVPTEKWIGRLSAAFSTSVATVTPERWLVTIPNFTMPNGLDGRTFVIAGSANYDSAGRVIPKNNNNVPDLTLDFSDWSSPYGIMAVQGNLAVLSPVGNGFISLYDTAIWPGTASMNFISGQVRDGFTQMSLSENMRLNIKLSAPAIVVFDIFAFVVANGTGRILAAGESASSNSVAPSERKLVPDNTPRRKAGR